MQSLKRPLVRVFPLTSPLRRGELKGVAARAALPKMATQMQDKDDLAKREVAIQWCAWSSEHARSYGGKPRQYALIPHDAVAENMTMEFLMKQYGKGVGAA